MYLLLAGVLIAATALIVSAAPGSDSNPGYRFSLTITSPDQKDITFSGASLAGDVSLKGKVGAIETIDLLTGGKLYALTPAIQTARELGNPAHPATDASGWPEWLVEPGRVNPITFGELIGQKSDAMGDVSFGAGGTITAKFDGGKLVQLKFPSVTGKGTTVYNYSDFKEDISLHSTDFVVPTNYQTTK
jgi:hypothetical protein